MSLINELLKATSLDHAGILSESEIYNTREFYPTAIPMMNVALSADPMGGVSSGLTAWCGPSRHFKSLFCLISAKAYLDAHEDGILIFFDSEFGTPPSYFEAAGIDPKRVLHVPITTYEDLKFDIAKKLDMIKRGDKVFIIIDSLGNLASKKEAADALKENSAADMTRAKENKSLFRIVTPHLRLKNISMHVVQHTYDTMEMYSRKVVSGGQGTLLSADNVFILGRQQDKDGTELNGYNFIINVEKSRYVKEKSKIPITVGFAGGIKRWSGLLDLAVDAGMVAKISTQSYNKIDLETGELIEDVKYKRKEIEYDSKLWLEMLAEPKFVDFIKNKYAVAHGKLLEDDEEFPEIDVQDE
ncbi:MAG: recombinase RecA [Hyphomicrobiales bacterium]|nr:MAG: recombinase RecA [Hyphomicrobiales bacterium]